MNYVKYCAIGLSAFLAICFLIALIEELADKRAHRRMRRLNSWVGAILLVMFCVSAHADPAVKPPAPDVPPASMTQAGPGATPAAPNAAVGPLGELQSFLLNNDTSTEPWTTNAFSLWEAAAFQNQNGVAGISPVGNDLGLEIPIHKWGIHLDSVTEFETVFGDIHSQAVGVAYDYNLYQIQLSAGLDVDMGLAKSLTVNAEPYFEFKKASTALPALAPFIRYGYPIRSRSGAGKIYVGVTINMPKLTKLFK